MRVAQAWTWMDPWAAPDLCACPPVTSSFLRVQPGTSARGPGARSC